MTVLLFMNYCVLPAASSAAISSGFTRPAVLFDGLLQIIAACPAIGLTACLAGPATVRPTEVARIFA